MRFRLKSLAIFLLCFIAQLCYAGEDSPELRADQNPPTTTVAKPEAPAVIEADSLVGQKENQIEATGDATISQGGQSIRADRLLYQQNSHELDAQGSVVLEQNGNTMSGPHLQFNLDSSVGKMEQPQFYLKENDARGSADQLHIQDRQHFTLDHATYTTCPAGNQDWFLKMGTLEIDRTRQIGTAWNATVVFKSVPILYSPWMDFPLNDQRKSGFLAPVFGGTTTGGSELTVPYYWNIAPNFDATIAPRVMTKRGLMLNNEFRYLEPRFRGELHVDVLPNDAIANHSRELFSLKHDQTLANNLNGYVNFTRVGDNAYFVDLGNSVSVTSQVNLLQEVGVNYTSDEWAANLRLQRYQTLQDPAALISVPYARKPQITIGTQQNHSGANLAFAGEYVDFSHPVAPNGSRLVLNPSVSYPLLGDSAFYITPKVALHSTYYAMGANNSAALPNASRTLPILSVDSGVAFERESNMFGGDYLQTFEPRAFYVYVPYRYQKDLPNFDSALADFNFTQIFTENRFSGSDRIGDANQITLAATSRLLDQNSGAERLKVMMGERFSLITPQVNPPIPSTTTSTTTPTTTTSAANIGRSDILLAALGKVTKAWSLDSELQFDPNQAHVQRYNIAAHYRPEAGKVFNMGYRFERNTLRTVDFSTQWPLFRRWDMVGRWNYSLQDSRILEAIVGLEYNQSCWTLRLVAQRFATATLQTNTSFFVQLELNELVKVGSDPLSLLRQSVLGYTKLNELPASKSGQVLQ
jgi:LPS-assembly protein